MPPTPKIYGYKLPSVVDDGSCVSITLQFPDILEYRAAVAGSINMLGKWFQWAHTQEDYQNIPELNKEVAQLWVNILASSPFEECVMSFCEQLIACLLTDEDTQAALASLISENPLIQSAIRDFVLSDQALNDQITNTSSYTILSTANRAENLLKPGACEPGFVFNQVSTLVSLLNSLSEDIFQAIEVATNVLERAEKLVSAIPVIGAVVPLDEIIAGIDQMAEEAKEEYENDWDEGLYDEIRCAMFCVFKDACEINITQAISFYEDLFVEELPDDPVELIVAIMGYIFAGAYPANLIVYGMHILALSAIQLSQNVLGVDFATMGLRIIAAGDESDNDWEILCEECGPVPNIVFSGTYYPDYDGTPKTFIANTPTGGSTWDITCQDIGGVSAAAIGMFLADGTSETCVYITEATGVDAHQHNQTCTGLPQTAGPGPGNPSVIYGPDLGFFGSGVIRVTFEPAP